MAASVAIATIPNGKRGECKHYNLTQLHQNQMTAETWQIKLTSHDPSGLLPKMSQIRIIDLSSGCLKIRNSVAREPARQGGGAKSEV